MIRHRRPETSPDSDNSDGKRGRTGLNGFGGVAGRTLPDLSLDAPTDAPAGAPTDGPVPLLPRPARVLNLLAAAAVGGVEAPALLPAPAAAAAGGAGVEAEVPVAAVLPLFPLPPVAAAQTARVPRELTCSDLLPALLTEALSSRVISGGSAASAATTRRGEEELGLNLGPNSMSAALAEVISEDDREEPVPGSCTPPPSGRSSLWRPPSVARKDYKPVIVTGAIFKPRA